ncbi:MAG: 4-hydroxy-3-methylbut-2-enyl diphosphate reductase [Elusimicrobiaceae bacterium]|nr:4-hydroxy-3-methylbut-2-enyl diphosphate reductase [Elusimicrobiaceae bacterium]
MTPKDLGVTLAKTAGFCPGVKKAIDCVLELAQKGRNPIYTLGPLIHNRQVIATLEEKNIRSIESLSEITSRSGVIVLRAHGITPAFEAEVRAFGMEVVDATCPLVKRVHRVIAEYADKGYDTVIVGDAGHAEVTGLLGYAKGRGVVVSGPEEAAALPEFERVNVVSQTTKEESVFLSAAEKIRARSGDCVISNTICQPTKDRQREIVELSKSVDLMVVVGGKHSANTARLAEICARLCPNAVHVESEDELTAELIRKATRIGITAGASTPSWMTDRVLSRARDMRRTLGQTSRDRLEQAWRIIIYSCAYTALSAVALEYACAGIQNLTLNPLLLWMTGLYVLSMHIVNRAAEKGVGSSDNIKMLLYGTHRKLMLSAGFVAGALALIAAALLGWKVFAVMLTVSLLGLLYPFRHFASKGEDELPGSKDIATALGWAAVTVVIPALFYEIPFSKAELFAALYAALVVFMRSVMLGISSVKTDLIIGKEHLYKAFGDKLTKNILLTLALCVTGLLLALTLHENHSTLAWALLAGNMYTLFCFGAYYFNRIPKTIHAETLVDGQFLVLGLSVFTALHFS